MNDKQLLFERMMLLNEDFNATKPKFMIPVGISGSGKSTWINANTDGNTVVVSPDDIRREITGDISDQTKNPEVFQLAFRRAIDALNAGQDVIFDATNVASFHRKKMLDDFRQKVERDFDAFAKIFDADPEVTKQRIKKDIEAGVDRAAVPDFAIDKQYQSFKNDLGKIESDGYKIID